MQFVKIYNYSNLYKVTESCVENVNDLYVSIKEIT